MDRSYARWQSEMKLVDEFMNLTEEKPLGRDLRAVGQAIEALNLREFEVIVEGDTFLIRGEAPPTSGATWGFLGSETELPRRVVELRCTQEIIRRIDIAGKAQRSRSNVMPDPLSPSQVLRAVGNSLGMREATATWIERRGDTVTIHFEDESGRKQTEERFISSFYGTSVRMHLDRAERSA